MASLIPHTILLKGEPERAGESLAASGTAIKPGMLIESTSTGAVKEHATAGGATGAKFAREMDIVGANIDDVYDVGDTVLWLNCQPGDWVYAWLEDEANVAVGALLESNGAGALQPVTAFAQSGTTPFAVTAGGSAIVKAVEAVNNTGGSGPVRIKVEVL